MTTARVVLWGTTIGNVSIGDDDDVAIFEYDSEFLNSGVEICPLMMPLTGAPYSFPALSRESFQGLPGMLADSLPDKFGNKLIDAWLISHSRPAGSMNSVERLCYTGTRGMGALEFFPEIKSGSSTDDILAVDELAQLASQILSQREEIHVSKEEKSFENLISVGTSAGGARAKAVIAINSKTGEVRSGQIDAGKDYEYYLIKFDRISNNKDKEEVDDVQHTLIEYAYYLMASAAGIEMSESRILSKQGDHFLTKRFDRTTDGDKIHMLSLAGMAHFDFNRSGERGYEEVATILRKLDCDYHDFQQLFRRMLFNHYAKNYDDHVKNISFLMQRDGRWSLAPAYDISYAFNPGGAWTSKHQMTINGKQAGIDKNDLIAAGKNMGITVSDINDDFDLINSAVSDWLKYAGKAGIREEQAEAINRFIGDRG